MNNVNPDELVENLLANDEAMGVQTRNDSPHDHDMGDDDIGGLNEDFDIEGMLSPDLSILLFQEKEMFNKISKMKSKEKNGYQIEENFSPKSVDSCQNHINLFFRKENNIFFMGVAFFHTKVLKHTITLTLA